jgi:hypothetical protein
MEVCCERALRKVFQCWENGVKTLHALYNKVFSFYGDEVISWRTEQTRLQPTRRASGPALARLRSRLRWLIWWRWFWLVRRVVMSSQML